MGCGLLERLAWSWLLLAASHPVVVLFVPWYLAVPAAGALVVLGRAMVFLRDSELRPARWGCLGASAATAFVTAGEAAEPRVRWRVETPRAGVRWEARALGGLAL